MREWTIRKNLPIGYAKLIKFVIQDADITGRLEIGLEIIFQERKKGHDLHRNPLISLVASPRGFEPLSMGKLRNPISSLMP
jgi:hypothetical protein